MDCWFSRSLSHTLNWVCLFHSSRIDLFNLVQNRLHFDIFNTLNIAMTSSMLAQFQITNPVRETSARHDSVNAYKNHSTKLKAPTIQSSSNSFGIALNAIDWCQWILFQQTNVFANKNTLRVSKTKTKNIVILWPIFSLRLSVWLVKKPQKPTFIIMFHVNKSWWFYCRLWMLCTSVCVLATTKRQHTQFT